MPSNDDYATAEGRRLLSDGSRLMGRAAVALGAGSASDDDIESILRSALKILRSAMNWLEDRSEFEVAHQRLDAAGKLARENFPDGCALEFRDGTYYQTCAAALAHTRVGMSVGYVIREAECSICHADPEDCDHIAGEVYDGERCVRILKNLDLLEVSLVSRPAQPDARIESMSMPMDDLRRNLGIDFEPGTTILCDRCLKPCDGVVRPLERGAEKS